MLPESRDNSRIGYLNNFYQEGRNNRARPKLRWVNKQQLLILIRRGVRVCLGRSGGVDDVLILSVQT